MLEQELAVQLLLDIRWQLSEYLQVSFRAYGNVFVILPPIGKVLLDLNFELLGNGSPVVEPFD